jgi:poly(3-hydroxybutyrate) depolymerase
MRRLVLTLAVFASLVLVVAGGAFAAKSGPKLKVTGSAHVAGGKLRGGFTVKNEGTESSPALKAAIKLLGPKKNGKAPKLTVAHPKVPALAPGAKKHLTIKVTLPVGLAKGHWSVVVCAGSCAGIGGFKSSGGSTGPGQKKAGAPNAPTAPAPSPPAPPAPGCTPSTGALAYGSEEPFHHVGECGDEYFGWVPKSYNPSTPMPLLIWAHGCGGQAEGDLPNVGSYTAEAGHGWLALSLGGRDGDCWTPSVDEAKVIAAVADFEAHFNVDSHRVFLSGYSSGGDLAYRTAFRHSSTFAGLIAENTSPFRDTESTQAESLAAATTKFHIVHLAHEQDEAYPLATVQSETNAVKAAGFPLELIVKPGTHFDGNTDSDLQELLIPYIEGKGWTSP